MPLDRATPAHPCPTIDASASHCAIRGQNPLQMLCTEDENVIEAIAPKRSNQPPIWVLPRRARRYLSVSDPHRPNPAREDRAVGAIIVAHQVGRRSLPRKCLDNILHQPLRRRRELQVYWLFTCLTVIGVAFVLGVARGVSLLRRCRDRLNDGLLRITGALTHVHGTHVPGRAGGGAVHSIRSGTSGSVQPRLSKHSQATVRLPWRCRAKK